MNLDSNIVVIYFLEYIFQSPGQSLETCNSSRPPASLSEIYPASLPSQPYNPIPSLAVNDVRFKSLRNNLWIDEDNVYQQTTSVDFNCRDGGWAVSLTAENNLMLYHVKVTLRYDELGSYFKGRWPHSQQMSSNLKYCTLMKLIPVKLLTMEILHGHSRHDCYEPGVTAIKEPSTKPATSTLPLAVS